MVDCEFLHLAAACTRIQAVCNFWQIPADSLPEDPPSSGLKATFSLMEKEKITQRFRLLLTTKNPQTSVRATLTQKPSPNWERGDHVSGG